MTTKLEYSLISVGYKSVNNIRNVVQQAANSSTPPTEIIILINHYQDSITNEILQYVQNEPRITRWSYFSQNVGVATAWNLGMMSSTTEHLIILNDDCSVGRQTYEQMVQPFENPEVGVVGVLAGGEGGDARLTAQGFLLAYRRSMILKIGGYSELASPLAHEQELGLRAWAAGYKTRIVPAQWEHVHDISNNPGETIYYLGRPHVPQEFQQRTEPLCQALVREHNGQILRAEIKTRPNRPLKINFIANLNPFKHNGGGEQVTRRIIESGLARGHSITVTSVNPQVTQYDNTADLNFFWDVFNCPTEPHSFDHSEVRELMAGKPYVIGANAYEDLCLLGTLPCGAETNGSLCQVPTDHPTFGVGGICRSHPGRCVVQERAHFWSNSIMSVFVSDLHYAQYKKMLPRVNNPFIMTPPILGLDRFYNSGTARDIDILCYGGQLEYKGFFNLYERFRGRDVVFFGGGGDDLIRRSNFGRYIGKINYHEVPRLLNRAKHFAHLPRWPEPFGLTTIQAYLCGCELILNENSDVIQGRSEQEIRALAEASTNCEPFWLAVESTIEKNKTGNPEIITVSPSAERPQLQIAPNQSSTLPAQTSSSRTLLIGASSYDLGWGGIQIQTLHHIKNSPHEFVIFADAPGGMSPLFKALPNVKEIIYCTDQELPSKLSQHRVDLFLHHAVNHTERQSARTIKQMGIPVVIFHYCCWPPLYTPQDYDLLLTESVSNERIIRQNPRFADAQIEVLELGLDFSEFQGLTAPADLKRQLNIPMDRVVIGRFGRLEPCKRPEDFIVAAGALSHAYPDKLFFILGGRLSQFEDDVYLNGIKELIKQSGLVMGRDIILTGEMQEREKLSVVNAMDIYLYPTHQEGYCMAFLEAMFLGKPVISYDNYANRDTISTGGIVVYERDLEALILATAYLVDNPEERTRFGQQGRDLVQKRNSCLDFARKLDQSCELALSRAQTLISQRA